MNHLPSHLKTGAAHKNRPQRLGAHALAVPNSELSKHGNWSAGFHNALNTPGGDPEQLLVFQRLMDEMGVKGIEVERALMQAKDADSAVNNVLRLVLKRSKAGKPSGSPEEDVDARLRGAVAPEQLQNIEALVRSLVGRQTGKEQAQAARSSKRVSHLGRLNQAESLVSTLLAV